AASFSWAMTTRGGVFDAGVAMPWILGGAIGGLVLALITIFKPTASPITAPIYALCEGLFLGAVSAMYEAVYGAGANGGAGSPFAGIVVQAAGLTICVLGVMLVLYMTRIIRVTAKLRAGIIAATGAVMVFYLVSIG